MRPPILTPDRLSIPVSLRMPLGMKAAIAGRVKAMGHGVTEAGYIREAVREKLERESGGGK